MPSAEHPATARKERDLRTLNELLDSEGWVLLLEKIILPDIARSMRSVFDHALRGESELGGKEAAHGDALIELVRTAYLKAERDIPEQIRQLKKGYINEHNGHHD